MALSGTVYSTFHNYYRLQIEWTATQDVVRNQSLVKANLFLVSLNSQSNIISSAPKTVSLTINGSTSSKTAAGLANLNGNQKKLIHSHSVTIPHNADGTKSFSMSAAAGIEVTLTNTFYSTVRTSGSGTLNQIPRSSTITSSANFVAGTNFIISVNRASSAFTHTARIKVNGKLIKTLTGVSTSVNSGFTKDQVTEIFKQLGQAATKNVMLELDTFNGSTRIGTMTVKTGTVTSPAASTFTAPTSFSVGSPISISIDREQGTFEHTVRLRHGTTTLKTMYGVTTSATMSTSDIVAALNALMPNTSSVRLNLEVLTYYNGAQIRSSASKNITANIASATPTFSNNFVYRDNNAATVEITKNSSYIIQNHSELIVEIPASAKAVAQSGATMSTYTAVFNGVSKMAAFSATGTVSFNFGKINSAANGTLSITATDSRGNKTTASKTVNILPYKSPTTVVGLSRANNFEDRTSLTLSGGFQQLNVAGTVRNSITQMQYRYKLSTTSTWGSWVNFGGTTSGASYTTNEVVLFLDNTKTYNFEIRVADKLTTKTDTKSIGSGYEMVALQILEAEYPYFKWTVNTDKGATATAVFMNGETLMTQNNPTFPVSFTLTPDQLREGENEMTIWIQDGGGMNHDMRFRLNKSFSLYPETQLTKSLPGGEISSEMTLKLVRTNGNAGSKLYRIIGGVN